MRIGRADTRSTLSTRRRTGLRWCTWSPSLTTTTHVIQRWLDGQRTRVGRHNLLLMTELHNARATILADLRNVVRQHYVDPKLAAQRLATLGAPATAQILQEHVPTNKRARSGDFGEILATEVAEQQLKYRVPIRRLRWKDGRNTALRGDDLIGVSSAKNLLKILKGESKSRDKLSTADLQDAGTTLDRDRGRPTRHSVLFVAERLRETGDDDDALATALETAALGGFRGVPIHHMLFTVCGASPKQLLTRHLVDVATRRRIRHAVGVHLNGHGDFIEKLFGGL